MTARRVRLSRQIDGPVSRLMPAGIPYLRTLLWAASIAGIVLVLTRLL